MDIKINVDREPTEKELELIQDMASAIIRKQDNKTEALTDAVAFLLNKDKEDQKDFECALCNANAALVAAHNMQRALKEEFLELVKYADLNVHDSCIDYNEYKNVAKYMSGIRVKVGAYEETVLPPDQDETHIGGIGVYVSESTEVVITYPEVDSYKATAYGVDYTTDDFMKYEVKVVGGNATKYKNLKPYVTDSAAYAMLEFVDIIEPKLIK